ncbi:hypothetical protein KEM52_004615, partial [Ascosphaera acerosa]
MAETIGIEKTAAPACSSTNKSTMTDTNMTCQKPTPVETSATTTDPRARPPPIVLTTYPDEPGIDPIPLDWGNPDPHQRGPVVASRRKPSFPV